MNRYQRTTIFMTYAQLNSHCRSHYRRSPKRHKKSSVASRTARAEATSLRVTSLVVVTMMIGLLLIIYLLQVNTGHNNSYLINDLNERKQQLEAEYEALTLENLRLESHGRLQEDSQTAEYQLPETVYFE